MTTASPIINGVGQDGSQFVWKKLSARIPEFLAQYGPDKGYAVIVRHRSVMQSMPELIELAKATAASGKDMASLPFMSMSRSVVFEATLEKDGVVLANATALKTVIVHKDWEQGETSARQRLLAALGFGGQVLDADEEGDMEAQGIRQATDEEKREIVAAHEIASTPTTLSLGEEVQANVEPQPEGEGQPRVEKALIKQLRLLAEAKEIEFVEPKTPEEARELMKKLSG